MGRGPRVKRRKPPAEEAQPLDTFEAEDLLPAEEQPKNVNKRYDMADSLEFELPSDVEDDEEIDEDMAFTEEDKIRYAGMFGDNADGSDGGSAQHDDLLASDESEDEAIHPDDLSDEEQQVEEHSDDEGRHAAMLADVRAASGASHKRKRRDIVVSEAYPESEYNLNPASTSAGGGGGDLQLSDLIKGLGSSRSKLGAARKTLERLERRSGVVAAPLPGNVQARQERKAAYEVTSQDVTKWQPMVKANREAPTLAFSKPRGAPARAATTAALTAQQAPETDMEAEVAAMLQAAGVHSARAVEGAEDALALKVLSAEESQARRDRLAKMRALLFYHERKAARMKAIKSKEYRRRNNKAEQRKAAKAGDGAGEALREAAEEAEFERAKERLTLKHKNTSKWAKRALRRGINVMDEATKDAMQEQLRLGMQLRQKVEQPQSSNSDSDGSTSASEGEEEGSDAGQDGGGASAPTSHEPGAAGRLARRKPAYSKSAAAALHVLQGGDEQADEQKGLFALPFMRRAAEQQKAAATQDAAALLHSIEAEVAGVPEDELLQEEQQGGAQGRFSFGMGAAFGQSGAAAVAAAPGSDDDSEAGEHEDAEVKAQRLARARKLDAAAAALFGGAPSGDPAAPPAVQPLLASRPDSTAHPGAAAPAAGPTPGRAGLRSSAAAAATQQASPKAPPSAGRRHSHLFGGGGAASQQQQGGRRQGGLDAQGGGVSIGPASRVLSASLAPGPAAAAAASAGRLADVDAVPASKDASSAPAPASGSGRRAAATEQAAAPAGSSEDEGCDALPPDAMRPAAGGGLSQRELIAMAFAGDDVAADFAAAKAAEAAEELPVAAAAAGSLPGWGSWANSRRMAREAQAAALKAKQQKAAALAKRKDAKQAHVVVSEKWDRRAQKYAAAAVPFPFDGRDTYERSIRQPLGSDFNTNASFRNLTRPAVIKEAGLLIQPLKYSRAASDKTAGAGRGGPRPAKGDRPPATRPRVKILAGGMPRN